MKGHIATPCTKFDNSELYFDLIMPLFQFENVQKIYIFPEYLWN